MSDFRQTLNLPLDGEAQEPSESLSFRENQELATDQLFEPLLERLTAAVIFLDRTSCVTYLSHQSDPLLAQTSEVLLGKTLWEVFPQAVDTPFFHNYHDALTASLAVHHEVYYPPLHKWFDIHILPSPDCWAISVQDVTQRKQAEVALSNIAAIVESSDDAIFSKTLEGIILSWNSGAEHLYGYTASEIIDQPVQTLIPADWHQEFEDIMHLLQEGKRIDHFETVRVRKDGNLVEVSVTISPVKDATGKVIGASTIARDITERKEMERRLRLSERRFRVLTERGADAIMQVDTTGNIEYVSPSTQHVLGYASEEILGRNAFELIHPDDRERMTTVLGRVLEQGEMLNFEFRMRHQDGSFRWLEASGVNLLDEPDIHAIVGNYRDITTRKQLQEQIWLSEQQLEAIIEGSPACISVKDVHGRYLRINQQIADLNHLSKEQMLGKTDDELFPNRLMASAQAHDQAILETGHAETQQVDFYLEDGVHTFLAVKFPLHGADGIPYAVCGISTDITERVVMEQRKDDFISMASHELKTPVTSLLGYTQLLHLLLVKEGHEKAVHYVSRMEFQLMRLSKLIAELLDMARVQGDKLVLAEEPVVMDELVREVVEHFRPLAAKYHIQIEGETAHIVVGDRGRIEQVILNLLSNAVKYAPGTETIVVRLEETSDEVTVSIQDFGIGIPAHHQERIFERFYRVASKQEKQFPGLGIGLYLCHEIIDHHGGRIWVNSVEGQGSTFCFALPTK